jgi:alanyl-tRNA synthetase
MAASRTTFEKLQRDRAKQAKAALKREKRQQRAAEAAAGEETPVDVAASYGEELSAGELLQLVEKLHKQFEDEVISFEDFEEQKAELMARLPVD